MARFVEPDPPAGQAPGLKMRVNKSRELLVSGYVANGRNFDGR
jgi:hypothetical protein